MIVSGANLVDFPVAIHPWPDIRRTGNSATLSDLNVTNGDLIDAGV